MSVHHRHGGPSHNKLEITTMVPMDDQFSSLKQIRWSAALVKLLVANGGVSCYHIRNADLSFSTKYTIGSGASSSSHAMDSDALNIYDYIGNYFARLYKRSLTTDPISYLAIGGGVGMIDAANDPLHCYITTQNATDGHGVRMVEKSTMTVVASMLSTGAGVGQFTNPLGCYYIHATHKLYVCEATRICVLDVTDVDGAEALAWNTSYAIAANDLTWDGTNFYVQTATQTIKYDNVFTDATKVAVACVGYSITYIPDQGDGYGATLAIVDNTNSHLERRKCSDLSAINSVGTVGDGNSSLFDPTFTSVPTQITYKFDDGFSYTTPLGTSHAISWNGFAGYSFRTAGPHKCVVTVQGGLGLVTRCNMEVDAITNVLNINKCINMTQLDIYTNTALTMAINRIPISVITLTASGGTTLRGSVLDYPRSAILIYNDANIYVSGPLSDLPVSLQQGRFWNSIGITPASIAHLIAIRDLRIYSMGWNQAGIDLVLLSISDAIHANVNHFTFATPALQIGGTHPAPSHLDGYFDPMIVLGAGVGDADHWDWDAALGKHKAKSGGSAIWVMTHNVGHVWSVTCTGGGPYP